MRVRSGQNGAYSRHLINAGSYRVSLPGSLCPLQSLWAVTFLLIKTASKRHLRQLPSGQGPSPEPRCVSRSQQHFALSAGQCVTYRRTDACPATWVLLGRPHERQAAKRRKGHRDTAQHPFLSLLPFSSLPAMSARSGVHVSDEGLPKLHTETAWSRKLSLQQLRGRDTVAKIRDKPEVHWETEQGKGSDVPELGPGEPHRCRTRALTRRLPETTRPSSAWEQGSPNPWWPPAAQGGEKKDMDAMPMLMPAGRSGEERKGGVKAETPVRLTFPWALNPPVSCQSNRRLSCCFL